MDEHLFWCVEFTNADAEVSGHIFTEPEALGNFVRVNARDAASFRITVTSENVLASDRVAEAFAEG